MGGGGRYAQRRIRQPIAERRQFHRFASNQKCDIKKHVLHDIVEVRIIARGIHGRLGGGGTYSFEYGRACNFL